MSNINYMRISNEKVEYEHNFVDYLKKLIGKILLCRTNAGKVFISKLVAINGDMLIFETSSGRIIVNNINALSSASEYQQKEVI